MFYILIILKLRKKVILFYFVVFVGGWGVEGSGFIFYLFFKKIMKVGVNLFCVFACLVVRYYFFFFNVFMVEREDVILFVDKIKFIIIMFNLILSL